MMKLYFSPGACSLSVHITVNEMGLPCEYEAVDLKTKKTASGADFLKVNPKGEVSTFVLDNGEVMTENAVIMQYLADHYKKTNFLPGIDDFNRYRILEWVNFITTDIHKSFFPLFSQAVAQEEKDNIFIPLIKKKFDFVDKHLENRDFVAADRYTLPDGYLFVMISWLPMFKIDMNGWKNIPRYFAAIKARPAVQKSLAEEGLKY